MEQALGSFHFSDIKNLVPESLAPILITLVLSFLIGLEREERSAGKYYYFGGVRTFPIIGLCGYLMARLTEGQSTVLGIGVLVLGALFWLSYRKKLESSVSAGMTSEVSGLFTFLMGALIYSKALWEATTLAVIVLLLLELKSWLEKLASKVPPEEIFTFTRFLLIFAVILPIVPNRDFTDLHFNPFHTWLIVVAISSLSYIAYIVGNFFGRSRGVVLTAILGGIYSSTATTVVLAKRSREEVSNHLFSGAIVIASGFMYFRLVVLLCVFNWNLAQRLLIPFLFLGGLFVVIGRVWIAVLVDEKKSFSSPTLQSRNPLELKAALLFAVLFSAMSVLSLLALQHFGINGVYVLSFLMGLTDVDPMVMSLTQNSGGMISGVAAAKAIIIAVASNNLMKGIYTAIWGSKEVRKRGALALMVLAFVSLTALIFV
ncbi:MAG: MgtC/SapB family protein [Bacillota bacterium]